MNERRSPQFKRSHFYIEKDFQIRFIMQFCLLLILGSALTISITYWMAGHSTTVAFANGRVGVHTTADYLLPLLSQTILIQLGIIALATVAMTLLISHKIAGPLYRLKTMLKSLAEGDVSTPMRLRQGDQLQNVATEYNLAISQLNYKIKKVQTDMAAISAKTTRMDEQAVRIQIKQDIDDLNKMLSLFKTS